MTTKYARYLLDVAEYMVVLGDGMIRAKGRPEEVHETGILTEDILGKDEEPITEQIDKNEQLAIERPDKRNWAAEEGKYSGIFDFYINLHFKSFSLFFFF